MSDIQNTADAKAVAFRGGGFAPNPRRWVGVIVFVVLILVAEWGTRALHRA